MAMSNFTQNPGIEFIKDNKDRYISCDYCKHFKHIQIPLERKEFQIVYKSYFECKALQMSFYGTHAYSFSKTGIRIIPSFCEGRYEAFETLKGEREINDRH